MDGSGLEVIFVEDNVDFNERSIYFGADSPSKAPANCEDGLGSIVDTLVNLEVTADRCFRAIEAKILETQEHADRLSSRLRLASRQLGEIAEKQKGLATVVTASAKYPYEGPDFHKRVFLDIDDSHHLNHVASRKLHTQMKPDTTPSRSKSSTSKVSQSSGRPSTERLRVYKEVLQDTQERVYHAASDNAEPSLRTVSQTSSENAAIALKRLAVVGRKSRSREYLRQGLPTIGMESLSLRASLEDDSGLDDPPLSILQDGEEDDEPFRIRTHYEVAYRPQPSHSALPGMPSKLSFPDIVDEAFDVKDRSLHNNSSSRVSTLSTSSNVNYGSKRPTQLVIPGDEIQKRSLPTVVPILEEHPPHQDPAVKTNLSTANIAQEAIVNAKDEDQVRYKHSEQLPQALQEQTNVKNANCKQNDNPKKHQQRIEGVETGVGGADAINTVPSKSEPKHSGNAGEEGYNGLQKQKCEIENTSILHSNLNFGHNGNASMSSKQDLHSTTPELLNIQVSSKVPTAPPASSPLEHIDMAGLLAAIRAPESKAKLRNADSRQIGSSQSIAKQNARPQTVAAQEGTVARPKTQLSLAEEMRLSLARRQKVLSGKLDEEEQAADRARVVSLNSSFKGQEEVPAPMELSPRAKSFRRKMQESQGVGAQGPLFSMHNMGSIDLFINLQNKDETESSDAGGSFWD